MNYHTERRFCAKLKSVDKKLEKSCRKKYGPMVERTNPEQMWYSTQTSHEALGRDYSFDILLVVPIVLLIVRKTYFGVF